MNYPKTDGAYGLNHRKAEVVPAGGHLGSRKPVAKKGGERRKHDKGDENLTRAVNTAELLVKAQTSPAGISPNLSGGYAGFTDPQPKEYLTLNELAAYAGVSKNTLRTWIGYGMPTYRISRTVRVRLSEFNEWMQQFRSDTAPKNLDAAWREVMKEAL
jgi:excisionase family DNA binding protein